MKYLTRKNSLLVKVSLVIVLLFMVQTPLQSYAAPFQTEARYSPGNYDLNSADYNGDGHLDLAAAVQSSPLISVRLGNGDGTFKLPATYTVGGQPRAMTSADFNGDGNIDLATVNNNSVSILLGNGDGTFASGTAIPVGAGAHFIAAADFNKDGKMDLTVSSSGGNVYVLRGNGDGTFQPAVNLGTSGGDHQVATGDFNADGKPDIVVCSASGNKVSILLGNGDGTFASQVDYPTARFTRRVVTGDLNKDGHLDLVAVNTSGSISILLGNGDGTFQDRVNQSTGADPRAIVIGDFVGDEEVDIIVGNFGSSNFSIFSGKGDGTFETATTYNIGIDTIYNLVSGDFNEDNVLDVAFTTQNYNNIHVLLGNHRNADLQSLSLSGGAVLSPSFSISELSYTSSVAYNVDRISVTSTVYDPTATVTMQVYGVGAPEPVASGDASSALPLEVGTNTIEVVVTAQDGTTIQTYTLNVTRANYTGGGGPSYSANANLSGLSLTEGVELSPAFTSSTLHYTSSVANNISSFSVTPTLADGKASVKVSVNGSASEIVSSGSASDALPLNIGTNVIDVTVTAEDGTSRGYAITVTRQAEAEAGGVGADPQLSVCKFTDIVQHWAKTQICEAAGLGIVEGVSANTFAPNREITRTEFAAMLLRALQIPIREQAGTLPFSDSESIPAWATSTIFTGGAEGMLEGYPDGTFRPQQTISRSEMAVMVAKAMKWTADSDQYLSYADGISIPSWATPYVEALHVNGLLQGRGGNQFVPNGVTTRAEAAVVMLRLWKTLH